MNNTWNSLANTGQYTALNIGTALSNSTSATDISPGGNTSGQAFQFAGDTLQPNQWFRLGAKGIVSNTSTPNLTLGVYLGGVAGTALATTGTVATSSSLSNALWSLELDFRVVAVGSSTASIYALGSASGPFASAAFMPATSSTGNLVGSLNTSTTQLLTVGATWGTASSSNTITCFLYRIERLNEGSS